MRKESSVSPGNRRVRAAAGVAFLLLALALAVVVVWRDRHEIGHGLHEIPVGLLLGSFGLATAAVVATFFMWRAMLAGVAVSLPLKPSARVFFLGQLGKYLPGSVWPVLAQMELARRYRVPRARMLASSVVTVVVNVAVGGALALLLLPFVSQHAFRHFWWLVICIPIIVFCLQPRIVVKSLDALLKLLRRDPLGVTFSARAEVKTAAWGLVSWIILGGHIYLLADGLGASGWRVFAASVAAGSLAISAGTLFVPAPAGAGVREVAFVLTLGPVVSAPLALLIALLSRVILIVSDVVLAGIGAAGGSWRPAGVVGSEELVG